MENNVVNEEMVSNRLFIGGLFDNVTTNDIRERFVSFGQVGDVQIIQRKDENGKIAKTFCYLDINSTVSKINKCISLYSKSKWKGHEIKVQIAKENYLTRLKNEWKIKNGKEIEGDEASKKTKSPCKDYKDIRDKVSKMKAIVPGTKISDEANWIVGKYGRPLPIVRLRHRNSQFIKFDPSKHCHQLKKINEKDYKDDRIAELSWSLEETDGKENHAKRKRKNTDASEKDNSVEKKSKVLSHSARDDDENKVHEKVEEIKNVSVKTGLNFKFDISSDFDENEKFPNLVRKKKDKLNLSKKDRNLSNAIKIKQDASSQRDLDLDVGKDKMENDEDSVTDDSTEGFGKSDIVFDNESLTEKLDGAYDLEVEQFAKEGKERRKELNDSSFGLGESIISQITKKRKVSLNDTDPFMNQKDFRTNSSGERYNYQKGQSFADQASDSDITSEDEFPGVQNYVLQKGNVNREDTSADERLLLESGVGEVSRDKQHQLNNDDTSSEDTTDGEMSNKNLSDEEVSDEEMSDEEVSNKSNESNDLSRSEDSANDDDQETEQRNNLPKNELTSSEDGEFNLRKHWLYKEQSTPREDSKVLADQTRLLSNDGSSSDDDESPSGKHQFLQRNDLLRDKNEANKKGKSLNSAEMKDGQDNADMSRRKKKLSEDKRLQSLNERKKKETEQRNLVTRALKSENLANKDSRHIQFESSDDATENTVDEKKDSKKVAGSAALSWLGLDNSDDSDDEITNRFEIKKQFEGSKGAKLFKLHQKAALDERFKIDARFLESESESEKAIDDETINDDDQELRKEMSRALSILDDLLGKRSRTAEKIANAKEKIGNDVIRYDPLDDMHAQYEAAEESDESEADLGANEQKPAEKPSPEVAKETFYDVSTNLKDLFKTQETGTFTFLNDDNKGDSSVKQIFIGEAETLKKKKYDAVIRPFDDESTDEEINDENAFKESSTESEKPSINIDKLFFFIEDDPRLRNEAIDGPSQFMRKKPLEELYRQLEAKRQRLRQDFKRKHKDAIRRLRKKKSGNNK